MDKEYIKGLEDAKDTLDTMDMHLRAAYRQGELWRESYPWENMHHNEIRATAITIGRLVNGLGQTRAAISDDILRIEMILAKEAKGDVINKSDK